ncbi:MAG TPA: glycerol-3-phosphate 1-O-acyltransferase PlsY, partial [Verrucomicrobiae bacterium]|nr:glycerol-3-phosphate 1-O-acyltransferase PlsY [Verrucomicrobiae bacterium]
MWSYILTAIAGYLLGSIPTGFLVARARGIDIRAAGSGNIGATNAMRVLGKPVGIFVLLMDAFKGFAACWFLPPAIWNALAPHFSDQFTVFHKEPVEIQMRLYIAAGLFAVFGHNYTCWLKFKGGKGIATSAGVYLALAPLALGIALLTFIVAVMGTRYASVGSIAAAIALPLAVYFTQTNDTLNIITLFLGAMAIYKHKS